MIYQIVENSIRFSPRLTGKPIFSFFPSPDPRYLRLRRIKVHVLADSFIRQGYLQTLTRVYARLTDCNDRQTTNSCCYSACEALARRDHGNFMGMIAVCPVATRACSYMYATSRFKSDATPRSIIWVCKREKHESIKHELIKGECSSFDRNRELLIKLINVWFDIVCRKEYIVSLL